MDAAQSTQGLQCATGASYARRRPESTLLYQIVERHYPKFLETLGASGRSLPGHVQREFEDYLKCGRLEHGFLRVRCEACHAEKLVAFSCKRRGFCPSCGARRMVESAALLVDRVLPEVPMRQWVLSVPFALRYLFAREPAAMGAALAVVYRTLAAFQRRKTGYRRGEAHCDAVTLIQRFGSALNLNVHFHMLMPDGVYLGAGARPEFVRAAAPTALELQGLVEQIGRRLGRQLERRGILVRDADSVYLELEPQSQGDALAGLQGHSITYRVAVGRRQGQKAFTLQTLGARGEGHGGERLAQANGFSLHAGVAAEAEERGKLERLCRYISRPAVATQRLSLTAQGEIRYALKTPYRDGTTHVVFEPADFILRLAALVPSPRVNLTRFHGVFAPHHRLRAGISARRSERTDGGAGSGTSRSSALGWAQRLKRVFSIDVERCDRCGGGVRIIACIEDAAVIEKILRHLGLDGGSSAGAMARAPPAQAGLVD